MFNVSYFFRSVLLVGIILFSTVKIYAQEEEIESKKNILKLSPQSFIASTFFLSYERYITKGTSFQLSGGILSAQKSNSDYIYYPTSTTSSKTYDKANGGIVEGMLKFYFLKGNSMMSGLYAGPYARYSNNRFRIHTTINTGYSTPGIPTVVDYRIQTYEGGVVIGYQFVIRNVFVMDLFAGGGVKSSTNTSPITYTSTSFDLLESQDYNGVVPKAGFRLGFAF